MAFSNDSIPQELRNLKQWVCWKYEQRGESKPTKIPLTIGGYHASSTDPGDWYTFNVACKFASKFEGIGFVFSHDDPYLGIDLDNCFATPGELKPWAELIMAEFDGTYAEISPSGNGIKLICIAENPLDRGRKILIDDGGVEMYNQGRFFTITGNVWDDSEPTEKQNSVDWLVSKHFSENDKPFCDNTKPVMLIDKVERAKRYLDKMEPAISGSKGHDACIRAACKMVLGFDLDTETAFSLLSNGYNSRCQPPWSEKELRHKVESADSFTTERGYLLSVPRFEIDSPLGVDLTSFDLDEKSDGVRPHLNPADLVPDGLLGEMVEWIRKGARFDQPEITLATVIAFGGMILGRRVRGKDDTRPNIFCLSIAESGTGKNHPRQSIKRIMQASGIGIPPEGSASPTGIIRALESNPSMVLQIDEAGLVFRAMKNLRSVQAELAAVYSELFTSSNGVFTYRAFADSKNCIEVDQPHLSINGTTTESSLYRGGFNHEDIEQGLFGRFLLFRPLVPDPPEQFDIEVFDIPESITERIRSWWQYEPWPEITGANMQAMATPLIVGMSSESKARYRKYAIQIGEKLSGDDVFAKAIWRRAKEKTNRLALIHACLKDGYRESITIEIDSMDWAIRICNYATRNMVLDAENAIVESEYEEQVKYVMGKIPDTGIENWKLSRRAKKLNPRERQIVISDLLETGMIRIEEVQTGGPPKSIIYAN